MRKFEDLSGRRFGRLVVLGYDYTDHNHFKYWRCLCDCGNETSVMQSNLINGRTSSCGCKKRERKTGDLTGQRFGYLTVLSYDHTDQHRTTQWRCLCDCGNEVVVSGSNLRKGSTKSCGCLRRENTTTHGMSNGLLYNVWRDMKNRCNNPNLPEYDRYGGRGIFVCDEWAHDFKSFYDWSLNNGYDEGLSIDRIDNDDGYYPENCRWVDRIAQGNNKRNNRNVTYANTTHTIAEWTRILNVDYDALRYRVGIGDMRYFEEYFKEDTQCKD